MARKRAAYGTSVSRAIKDDKLPNAVQSGVLKALFDEGDIPEYLLEELVNSVGMRADRMYTYGRDHYTHGLPSGQFTVAAEGIETTVGTVLLGIEGSPVTIDYLRHGPANSLHIGWTKLIDVHGYNPATNQLGALTTSLGTPVYLDDMVVVVPGPDINTIAPESLQLWGIAARAGYTPERTTGTAETRAMLTPTGVRADPLATDEVVRVSYVWMASGVLNRNTFDIPLTGFIDEADYYHVRYLVGSVVKYWMYRDGAGTYASLDGMFDHLPTTGGSFFPFAYFRYNHTSELADTGSASYLTGKRLVKYLGMDYDQVAQAIDDNPDIDDVEQAMLMMAVPANTTNEMERRYLFDFFNNVYLASSPEFRFRSEAEAAEFALSLEQQGLHSPGIVIQDARFKLSLDNRGIYKRRKPGVVGPIGSHDSTTGTIVLTYTIIVEADTPYEQMLNVPIVSHYYRRQITNNYYDEIQVVDLRTLFHISGSYTSIGDDTDTILLIPLDQSVTSEYSIPDRENLYARSLHFVFNSLVYTTVAWYQTEFFQFVLLVVAVIITAYSWGADGGSAIGAALAAGNYVLAAALIFNAIVNMLVIRGVFKLFVKAVGIRAAFIIAIIAAVFGIANMMDSGSVAGAPYASDLLTLSSGIMTGIDVQLKMDMQALLNEATAFSKEQEEQVKLLETAQELLENSVILSPFVIFGEKPQEFYDRTVHSGNIGVVGIDAVSSYVDMALRLPELHETMREYT